MSYKGLRIAGLMLLTLTFTTNGFAQGISYATESGIGIVFGGEVELEFVDVEGPGGFSHQDLTYQKVSNRSPHLRIDRAITTTRVVYSDNLFYYIEMGFYDDKTKVDRHYARLKLEDYNTVLELGKNKPMVATSRKTEAYPLIGTAFWKGREYHITSNTKFELGDDFELELGLSFAMKRPLGTDDAAEDKSFKMLIYDDYEPKNGQTFEYGVMVGAEYEGVFAQGWYYYSQLIDDYDWKTMLSQTFSEYDSDNKDHNWYGGRVGYDNDALLVRAEYISGTDGLLKRSGYYVDGGYTIGRFTPLVRYGTLNLDNLDPQIGNTLTWDRQMTAFAVLTKLHDYITLKVEYYLLDETTGGTGEDEKVKDNQLLVQMKFEF